MLRSLSHLLLFGLLDPSCSPTNSLSRSNLTLSFSSSFVLGSFHWSRPTPCDWEATILLQRRRSTIQLRVEWHNASRLGRGSGDQRGRLSPSSPLSLFIFFFFLESPSIMKRLQPARQEIIIECHQIEQQNETQQEPKKKERQAWAW